MEWYSLGFQRYADFSGRSRRKEYWYFTLFSAIVSIILTWVDVAVGTTTGGGIGILSGLYALVILVPSLAIAVRRLHDIGKSGWFFLISLIPFIGGLVLLYFLFQDSDRDINAWGPSPKYSGFEDQIENIGMD